MNGIQQPKPTMARNCDSQITKSQKARNLKPWGMELLVQVKDEDDNVSIWGKMRRNTVRQLLIVTDDKMVRIKGKFDLDKIANMLNSAQQK